WEEIEAEERAARKPAEASEKGLLEDIAHGPDPLRQAERLQAQVARVGFDWPEPRGAWKKVREEIDEVGAELDTANAAALEDEIGDLLFSVVNLARLAQVDAPTALARANRKFRRRFAALERLARERGVVVGQAGLQELDTLWDDAKREEQ